MAGKINVYGWGDEGVDLVSTPLHAKDGSFRRLQNGEFSNIEGEGGIKKRGSLNRLNTSPLNSGANILTVINMPLETDAFDTAGPEMLVASLSAVDTGAYWRGASDGLTYALLALMTTPALVNAGHSCNVTLDGTLYFGSSAARLWSWDGVTLTAAPAFPADPSDASAANNILSVTADATTVYMTVSYGGGNLRVYKWVPGALSMTEVGDVVVTGGDAGYLTVAFGVLWMLRAAAGGSFDGKIFRINPASESVWTLDHTFSGTTPTGSAICTFQGNVIVGIYSNTDNQSKLWRATAPGTWTAVQTFNGVSDAPFIVTLIPNEADSTVIATVHYDTGVYEAWVSDTGVSWSLDFTLTSLWAYAAGCGAVLNGVTYLVMADTNGEDPFNGNIVRRTAGATWALAYNGNVSTTLGIVGGA